MSKRLRIWIPHPSSVQVLSRLQAFFFLFCNKNWSILYGDKQDTQTNQSLSQNALNPFNSNSFKGISDEVITQKSHQTVNLTKLGESFQFLTIAARSLTRLPRQINSMYVLHKTKIMGYRTQKVTFPFFFSSPPLFRFKLKGFQHQNCFCMKHQYVSRYM